MSIYAASAPLKSMTTHGLHALSGRLMCRIGDYRKMLPDWPALTQSLSLDLDKINAELARRSSADTEPNTKDLTSATIQWRDW